MADRFQRIWQRQIEQQEQFNMDPTAMDPTRKALVAKDLILGLGEEVVELSRVATRYKAHILKAQQIERQNVADEVVDVLKYLISIAQLHGITSQELFDAFMRKSDVVSDRALGERLELERDTKLVAMDIDNCLADMSEWQAQLDAASEGGLLNDRKVQMLELLKRDFYKAGGFRNLKPMPGAVEATHEIRRAGFKIVLITARPHWHHKRLYSDTLYWLKQNDVAYDLILFNKDKAEAITENIFPARPFCFIEDMAKHANDVAALGVPVLLMDWSYNRNVGETDLIRRVKSWPEIVEIIKSEGIS